MQTMTEWTRIVECVLNFSEGRRPDVVARLVAEVETVAGVVVLDTHSDADHNRSVITFVGEPEAVVEAAVRVAAVAVELIDLRSLNPFDWDTIAASVAKTNRALVAYEDTLSWGYGAEIAARIADDLFEHLDAPVRRVAAEDTFVAYQPILENAILPQMEDVYRAMKELTEF